MKICGTCSGRCALHLRACLRLRIDVNFLEWHRLFLAADARAACSTGTSSGGIHLYFRRAHPRGLWDGLSALARGKIVRAPRGQTPAQAEDFRESLGDERAPADAATGPDRSTRRWACPSAFSASRPPWQSGRTAYGARTVRWPPRGLLRPDVQNERVLVHEPDDIPAVKRPAKVCARVRSS